MNQENRSGMWTKDARPVPLKGVAVEVDVKDAASRVSVTHRYRNEEKVPVEAVYSFPLEEGSAVCGFEAEVDGRRITGRVEEREAAFDRYDEALAGGHGAFLLDQDRPNVFTASIGNLRPGSEAVVRLSYVAELSRTGDRLRLMLPATISPRYVPPRLLREMDPAELDHLAPPVDLEGVPYGLRLHVAVEASGPIRGLECPSHPVRVQLDGNRAEVWLSGEDAPLDQDFVLTVELAEPHRPGVLVAKDLGGDGLVALVSLFPDLKGLSRPAGEFVFVLDRSGSMRGESIGQAKKALLLCLRALEEGDRFNVVGFGFAFVKLFPRSVPYTQANLDAATRHVESLDADLGGTEILGPLQSVLEDPVDLPRQVLLLTDGEVANEAEVIALAARHAGRARIFPFGIGRGADEHLVRGLARATGGAAEFIHPGERIEPKVLRQLARVSTPNLSRVEVDWGGLEVDLQAPRRLPPLYAGDPLTVYARFRGREKTVVTLRAESDRGAHTWAVEVDPAQAGDGDTVARLMARAAIRELEEAAPEEGSSQFERKRRSRDEAALELALRYQLLSSATSFVAVEHREDARPGEAPVLRRVPVALTRGWGGLDRPGAGPLSLSMVTPAPVGSSVLCCIRESGTVRPSLWDAGLSASASPGPAVAGVHPNRPDGLGVDPGSDGIEELLETTLSGEGIPAEDRFVALIKAQRADGSWELTEALAVVVGIDPWRLAESARSLPGDPELVRRALATALALHLLERDFADREEEWRLPAAKARRWLDRQPIVPPSAGWLPWARVLLGGKG